MHRLDVFVKDAQGNGVPNQLVELKTYNMMDWAKPGIQIFPNPRRTDADGRVNFYNGPELQSGINCQGVCQNGMTDPAVGFDGTSDVVVEVPFIPFG